MAPWERLDQRVARRIAEQGHPVPFAQFMDLALYAQPTAQAEGGYYASGKVSFGPGGDFFTSPEMYSPEYGQGFARLIAEYWEALDRPSPFWVIEMGGGNGTFTRDIAQALRTGDPALAAAVRPVLLEISPALIKRQRRTAEDLPIRQVHASATALPFRQVTGVFLSNELVDAFPLHRLLFSEGRLLEIYVGVEDGEYYETALEPSDPALEAMVAEAGWRPPDGVEFCISPLGMAWMRQLGAALDRGYVITIDYGYLDRALMRERGVPARYFGQQHAVGSFDITADIDFEALIAAGRSAGLMPLRVEDEVDFTRGWNTFEMGVPGKDGRARYVLVQRKG